MKSLARKKRLFAVCTLSLLLILFTAAAPAIEGHADTKYSGKGNSYNNDQFEGMVVVGLENNWRLGAELPISVYVTSKTSDFEGSIRLILPKNEYGFKGIAFEKPVLLKMGEEKIITQSVSGGIGSGILYMQLVDQKDKVVLEKSFTVNQNSNSKALIGVLSDDFTGLNYFDDVMLTLTDVGYNDYTSLLELDEKNFPSQASSLNVLSYLLIDHFDSSRLSEEQYAALKKWVASGGVLIVGTGADYKETLSLFKDDFLSGQIKEGKSGSFEVVKKRNTGSQTNPGGGTWVEESAPDPGNGQTGTTGSGNGQTGSENGQNGEDVGQASVGKSSVDYSAADGILDIAITGGKPLADVVSDKNLIWCKPYENGNIVVAAWDFAMKPVFDYSLRGELARNLLEEAARGYAGRRILSVNYGDNNDIDGEYSGYQNALRYAMDPGLPNTGSLSFFVIAFLLIAGPGLYLILKKLDKRELLWILVPAASVIATMVVFLSTSNLRMKAPLSSSITIMQYEEDPESGDVTCDSKIKSCLLIPDTGRNQIDLVNELSSLRLLGEQNYYYNSNGNTVKNLDYDTVLKESAEGYSLDLITDNTFQYKAFSMDGAGGSSKAVFDIDISNSMQGFSGSVTNISDYDMDYVMVLCGTDMVVKKAVGSGETASFTVAENYQCGYDSYAGAFTESENLTDEERRLVGTAVRSLHGFVQQNSNGLEDEVYVLGFKYHWDADYIRNGKVKEKNMALFVCHESVPMTDFENGVRVSLKEYFSGGDNLDEEGQLYDMEATAQYQFSDSFEKLYAITRTEVMRNGYSDETEVWAMNYETKQFEKLFAKESNMIFENGKCPYINSDKAMELRFKCPRPYECYIPVIHVIGGFEDVNN